MIGAVSQSASAICRVQLELHNLSANHVTVNFANSDVRQQPVGGALGPWTTLGNLSTTVPAGAIVNPGSFVPAGCVNVDRQYRPEVTEARSATSCCIRTLASSRRTGRPPIHPA